MEEVRKKSWFRKFIDWLGSNEVEEIVDGKINAEAFKEEDPNLLKELNSQVIETDKRGVITFKDVSSKNKRARRAPISPRATVQTPPKAVYGKTGGPVSKDDGNELEQ